MVPPICLSHRSLCPSSPFKVGLKQTFESCHTLLILISRQFQTIKISKSLLFSNIGTDDVGHFFDAIGVAIFSIVRLLHLVPIDLSTYLPVYLSTCLPIERASFYFLLNFMALERGKVEKNYQNWFVLLRPENRLTRMAFFPFGRPQSGKMLFLRQRGPARLVSSPRPLFMEKKRIRVKRKSSANVLCSFLFRSFYFLILHKVTNTKATKTGRGSKGDKNKLK